MKTIRKVLRKLIRRVGRTRIAALLTLKIVLPLIFPQIAVAAQPQATLDTGLVCELLDPPARETSVPAGQLPTNPDRPPKQVVRLTVTAYSSTVDQTDGDPFTTASGAKVHDGMIAYNYLPFGTKVRFPDVFGDKVFVVEDRLNPRHGRYIADIWMPTREDAIKWGAPVVKMEIL